MQFRMAALLALLASGCGSNMSHTNADVQAYQALALGVSSGVQSYRSQAAAMADLASCNGAASQYDAQVRPMVQRMEDMSGSMDTMMDSQGRGSHGDMGCMSAAMRAELDEHKTMACASADMAANQAEATRHADSMEGYAAHQQARAEEMMSMMGGGMMSGGSGTADAGTMGGCYRAVDGGYMMDGGF